MGWKVEPTERDPELWQAIRMVAGAQALWTMAKRKLAMAGVATVLSRDIQSVELGMMRADRIVATCLDLMSPPTISPTPPGDPFLGPLGYQGGEPGSTKPSAK